jgi:hypothetical protein
MRDRSQNENKERLDRWIQENQERQWHSRQIDENRKRLFANPAGPVSSSENIR